MAKNDPLVKQHENLKSLMFNRTKDPLFVVMLVYYRVASFEKGPCV